MAKTEKKASKAKPSSSDGTWSEHYGASEAEEAEEVVARLKAEVQQALSRTDLVWFNEDGTEGIGMDFRAMHLRQLAEELADANLDDIAALSPEAKDTVARFAQLVADKTAERDVTPAPEPIKSGLTPVIKTTSKVRPETVAHTMPKDADQVLEDVLVHRGWDKRVGQVQMVDAINDAIHDTSDPYADIDIAVNAPVGTGKTLAYLIACLVNGMRVVISTSTKGLQDQIVQEELPKLRDDLRALYGFELTYGVLKGKSNYACARTVKAMLSGDMNPESEDNQLFSSIDMQPDVNDIDTLEEIDARITRARETQDSLNFDSEHLIKRMRFDTQSMVRASKRCAGKSEPWVDVDPEEVDDFDDDFGAPTPLAAGLYSDVPYQVAHESDCVYRAAYAHAMTSQVVVVNTTLLIYEIMRANSPMGGETKPSLLRGVGMVIVDEAHHLFANISEAYSVELDFGSLKREASDIAKRLNKRYSTEERKVTTFNEIIDIIEHGESALDDILDDDTLSETVYRQQLNEVLNRVGTQVNGFTTKVLIHAIMAEREKPSGGKVTATGVPKVINSLIYGLNESMDNVNAIATKIVQGATKEGKKKVDHYNSINASDPDSDDLVLKTVPIDVGFFRSELSKATGMGNPFVPPRDDHRSIVTLSSGTITENTSFVVGMRGPIFLDVDSPFDPKKVRLYVPMMYAPSDPRWRDDAWEEMVAGIRQVGGRTLSLHTALGRMNEFVEMARADLEPEGYTIFTQNSGMSKLELIEAFRNTSKSVLFGSRSFMEGVDVPGTALSLVILDKIPFPQVDDAMFEARREFIKKRHPDPRSREAQTEAFMKVDVDFAAVMLAQITGRLIRGVDDVGGIMILDHRILTGGYASKVAVKLPPTWAVTRERRPFMKWLEWVNPDTREGKMPKVDVENTDWRPIRQPKLMSTRRNIGRSS